MNATDFRQLAMGIVATAAACACGPTEGSIGALLGKSHRSGQVIVRETPRDMTAWKAGLRPGDELLSIDGRDVRYMTAQQIHEALVGPVHSTVRLTVLRDGSVVRLAVERGALK
jgi:C-terminal processing protease CtpA/Prc